MWNVAWRVIRVAPVIGIFIVLATSAEVLRRKGYMLGTLAVVLDILPVVCVVKACVEVFTGDLIPNKFEQDAVPQLEQAA